MQFPLGPGVCAGLAEQKLRREAGWQEEEAAEGLFLHLPDHGVPAQLHAQREPQPLSRLPSSAFLPDSRRSLPVRTGATDPFKTETAQGAPQESRPWQEAVMLGGSLWGCAPPALSGERRGAGGLELLLLLVLSGWVWAQQPQLQAAPCPTPCECSEAHRIVKCVNKNLTEVPPELPPFVQGLFLPSNCIRNLSSASFLSASLSGLSSLSLRGNRLSWVGAETFAGLPRLKQLDLSDNSLTWLSPVALGNASSPLEELDLSSSLYNSSGVLLVAELLQTGTLLSLKHLDLSGNSLVYLPASMFSALPSLEHLDMHNNSLVSLRTVFFGSLQQLQSFNLGSNAFKALRNGTLQQLQGLPLLALNLSCNPWVCDCHIEDLVNWLKESKQVEAKGALKCSYPRELQERSLVSINVSELSCPLPIDDQTPLQTSYVFLGIVLALIGAIFLLVLYLNRKGIKKWVYNIRDACRDHMEGYHYRYEINTDPRLTNLNSNSDV